MENKPRKYTHLCKHERVNWNSSTRDSTAQTWELKGAEHVRDKYIKHSGEDMGLIINHEQITYVSYVLVVIPKLRLSVQGLHGLHLLTVCEPQGVYWIAMMHVVTCAEALDENVKLDPGRFLSTMSGEQEPDHTERAWKMQMIGVRGYKLISINDLSTPWDPDMVAIYESAAPVRVKPS
jgi:hypothetical protein